MYIFYFCLKGKTNKNTSKQNKNPKLTVSCSVAQDDWDLKTPMPQPLMCVVSTSSLFIHDLCVKAYTSLSKLTHHGTFISDRSGRNKSRHAVVRTRRALCLGLLSSSAIAQFHKRSRGPDRKPKAADSGASPE